MKKRASGVVELHLPGGAEGDDDVIAGAERQIAELGLQRAGALMHPPGLICLGVAIEIVHAFGCAADAEDDVVVAEQRGTRRDGIGPERGLDAS